MTVSPIELNTNSHLDSYKEKRKTNFEANWGRRRNKRCSAARTGVGEMESLMNPFQTLLWIEESNSTCKTFAALNKYQVIIMCFLLPSHQKFGILWMEFHCLVTNMLKDVEVNEFGMQPSIDWLIFRYVGN